MPSYVNRLGEPVFIEEEQMRTAGDNLAALGLEVGDQIIVSYKVVPLSSEMGPHGPRQTWLFEHGEFRGVHGNSLHFRINTDDGKTITWAVSLDDILKSGKIGDISLVRPKITLE